MRFRTSYFVLLLVVFGTSMVGCWDLTDHPFLADDDLYVDPVITDMYPTEDGSVILTLNHAYGSACAIVLERRTDAVFHGVDYERLSARSIADTTIDWGGEGVLECTYRVVVEKDGLRTRFSPERTFHYEGRFLNPPGSLQAYTVELEGVRLEWLDNSNLEEGYEIHRDEGGGWEHVKIAPANSASYLDSIPGPLPEPVAIGYRLRAYGSETVSEWREVHTAYSGIRAPTLLAAAGPACSGVIGLEWEDNSSVESGYAVERGEIHQMFQEIARLGFNTETYTDTVDGEGTYKYRVRAVREVYASPYSNELSVNIACLTPEPIAYYPFNGNADDMSGNNRHGIVHGPVPATDRFGNSNSAYVFDGNDYIDLRDLELAGSFSVSVWVRAAPVTDWAAIISKISFFGGWYLGMHPTEKIRMTVSRGFMTYDWVQGGDLQINEWTHIAVTYQNNYGPDQAALALYQDGERIVSKITTVRISTTGFNLLVGLESETMQSGFRGAIDEVRIYDVVLTEGDVTRLAAE